MQLIKELIFVFASLAFTLFVALAILAIPVLLVLGVAWVFTEVLFS